MSCTGPFAHVNHEVDLCVVGGGMPGVATAISAARHGAKVVLMHDRPVLGGNASSECRVHICGADRHGSIPHMRETGLLEELRMLNLRRNPNSNFFIHDTLVYELVRAEPNITLLLNCTCQSADMDSDQIVSVTGWQLASETYHTVGAKWFADCTGDGILAPLTGAEFRIGREASSEYGEKLAPASADDKTMGHSIRFQTVRRDTPQTFVAPPWAHVYETCDDLPYGLHGHSGNLVGLGFWWIELGGEHDTIGQTEYLRDELLKIAYGVWDHIKNRCPHRANEAKHLDLEWMQFLPAKRESRRYIGAHVLSEGDVLAGGAFDDVVGYGGWSMDDHNPAGFYGAREKKAATIYHQCPSPFGIPYRSLYSANLANLFFTGRDLSATHMAMSSTRVMGTGMTCGQAIGTAVGIMVEKSLSRPAEVGEHMGLLQQRLLWDDCYLPRVAMDVPELTATAKLTASAGDAEAVRDGYARQIDDDPHAWVGTEGGWLCYEFDGPRRIEEFAVAFDTNMHIDPQFSWSMHRVGCFATELPAVLPQRFVIEVRREGQWTAVAGETDNIHRSCRQALDVEADAIRLRIERLHGQADETRVYSFIVR